MLYLLVPFLIILYIIGYYNLKTHDFETAMINIFIATCVLNAFVDVTLFQINENYKSNT